MAAVTAEMLEQAPALQAGDLPAALAGTDGVPVLARDTWALRLGMPHLGVAGLSERWFLAQAGHVHWSLVSEALDTPSEHWLDARGNRLYASFVACEIEGGLLAAAREGDVVRAESRMFGGGRDRLLSVHRLAAPSGAVATLWMLSCFVRRDGASNHTFVRGVAPRAQDGDEHWMAGRLLDLRRRARHASVAKSAGRAAAVHSTVRAVEDFNAAGRVYFATFPRFADRAEACSWPRQRHLPPLLRRCAFYYGNADHGDALCSSVQRSGADACVRIHAGGKLIFVSRSTRRGTEGGLANTPARR